MAGNGVDGALACFHECNSFAAAGSMHALAFINFIL